MGITYMTHTNGFDHDELALLADAMGEFIQNHPEKRDRAEQLADKVVRFQASEADGTDDDA